MSRDPSSVLVLASERPSEPHVDVALLQLDQYEADDPQVMAELIQRLREKAAELGCDAVYLESSARRKGDLLFEPAPRQLLASCIVFTPPDSTGEVEAEIAHSQKRE